jgi:hypothetical protein
MDKPVKIIFKYKNSRGNIQYNTYIFVGNLIKVDVQVVLDKIKDMGMYSALTELNTTDLAILQKEYGEKWYQYFFNSHHISQTVDDITKNKNKIAEIVKIYGDAWYQANMQKKSDSTVSQTYEYSVKKKKDRSMIHKLVNSRKLKDVRDIDYSVNSKQLGGESQYSIAGDQNKEYSITVPAEMQSNWCKTGGDATIDNVNLDSDVYDIYNDLDKIDEENNNNIQAIKKAIEGKKNNVSLEKMIEFDESKNEAQFSEKLKNNISKIYVTNHFIYMDDTIKNIRGKICSSIFNSSVFTDNCYLIPSYQYMWTEYKIGGVIKKAPIGHKWVSKNKMLQIDIEPNENIRVYEKLSGNLEQLQTNIRRQGKINMDNDLETILHDYEDYVTFNEIFMIDIYHEIGKEYTPDATDLKNLSDVYLKIYFPFISQTEITNILNLLKTGSDAAESNKLRVIYQRNNNDLIMEREIRNDIDKIQRKGPKEYSKYTMDNNITQSALRTYLIEDYRRIDLFNIFDNFAMDDKYPFIQYQPADGISRFKIDERIAKETQKDTILKWFENTSNGLNIKILMDDRDRYMTVTISDTGRLDYKVQWKEIDGSSIQHVEKSKKYIHDMIDKITAENVNNNLALNNPPDENFQFSFINSIKKFVLPDNKYINHNDLSDFSRYFYPFVALVIEPRKRISKEINTDMASKYGTYLRYKLISRYDNYTKIEQRVIYFMKNYEYDDASLANIIAKEFNITEEQSLENILSINKKYPNLKKSRKILRTLDKVSKYKPPGIGIEIQGKTRDKYKIKITGAKNKFQMERISTFLDVLIYLYVETYINKNPSYQRVLDKLKKLNKIARRRNIVNDVIDHPSVDNDVKKITSIDSKRLNFKIDSEQNQWTRNCQNSGNDKRRRPQQILTADELRRLGYEWSEDLDGIKHGHYFKKVMVDKDGNIESKKKKYPIILRAAELYLDAGKDKPIYYICSPEHNGKHMFLGFLNKSKNPQGSAPPCCFIKDQLKTNNEEKRNFHLRNIGALDKTPPKQNNITVDQLYILQDSNKIQEGRFAFLPEHLDILLNRLMKNSYVINNHYLTKTNSYFFKYGTNQFSNRFLNAISPLVDISIADIIAKIAEILRNDKDLLIFNSLNSGDIRTDFQTVDNYINYLETNTYLDHRLLIDIMSIPGVIDPDGVNIIIFKKKSKSINIDLEKIRLKINYQIICRDSETIDFIIESKKKNIILVMNNVNYYPVIEIKKNKKKYVSLTKLHNYANNSENIMLNIHKYYVANCSRQLQVLVNDTIYANQTAKETTKILNKLKDTKYHVKYQVIDHRYKCRFVITNGGLIITTNPSGSLYNIPIIDNVDKYVTNYKETCTYLHLIQKITKNKLLLKPVGIFYEEETKKDYLVSAIMTYNQGTVPIIKSNISKKYIRDNSIKVYNIPIDEKIDKLLIRDNSTISNDPRISSVKTNHYRNELYQLFRYHLSYFLNKTKDGLVIRDEIINLASKNNRSGLKYLLYQISDKQLAEEYKKVAKKQKGGEEWINVTNDEKKIDYDIENNRIYCYINNDKNACDQHKHCNWDPKQKKCALTIQKELLIDFINLVTEEFLQEGIKSDELLQNEGYFVSNIVDRNVFQQKKGVKVLMGSNIRFESILKKIFGTNEPINITKRLSKYNNELDYYQLNIDNPLKPYSNWLIQNILDDNSIFRAFANSYYWHIKTLNSTSTRNLGFASEIQTELSNIYKSQVITWLSKNPNIPANVLANSPPKKGEEYAIILHNKSSVIIDGYIELYVLSIINNIDIHLHDTKFNLINVFSYEHGMIDTVKNTSNPKIHIRFLKDKNEIYPNSIQSIYPISS